MIFTSDLKADVFMWMDIDTMCFFFSNTPFGERPEDTALAEDNVSV